MTVDQPGAEWIVKFQAEYRSMPEADQMRICSVFFCFICLCIQYSHSLRMPGQCGHSPPDLIPKRPVHRTLSIKERNMYKMAIFLGGFLTLTILIGVLATISPV